ncbi:hypothetical protein [Streptomyces sp. TS71-3]|uniref:hypothetical protein n=1 Tax=Streptomyces sp. TS71-3 TaxID=2733862 RepID=UPI001B1BB17F|nr:hypothetical protein [Streptomyces sp. TS71-3]GHJ39774.1 hypothetical protein Sm713_53830 [Streptomyces sp. TS71-3]
MTLEETYGTRPDLLPRSMVRLARTEQREGRKLTWVGRPDVLLLDLDQHLRYEHESLGRFPRHSDGTIAWAEVSADLVLVSTDEDTADLDALIRQHCAGAKGLVVFWGSLALPSAQLPLGAALSHLSQITDSHPEFWIYDPEDSVLMENTFAGRVTVARVPTDTES